MEEKKEDRFLIIAGPCAIESYDQAMTLATELAEIGVDYFRGGIYKPRSNRKDFQGIGEKGVPILQEIQKFLPVVSETTQVENIGIVASCADVLQIGSRNMHNIELLREVGKTTKTIMFKRGYAAKLEEEWIPGVLYLNRKQEIWMCERGIRTFETYTRNTLDLAAIHAVKQHYDFPVIIDPSHAAGRPDLVIPLALAGIAAGANGIMIEVHNNPSEALCDGHQAISVKQLKDSLQIIYEIADIVRKDKGGVEYV